jgi:hypothetical protein
MKDQYFGDLNDFLKYALLRRLVARGLRIGVCWMLTPPDGRTDGGKLAYLERPRTWHPVDPPLFEFLGKAVRAGRRSVAEIQSSGLLDGTSFFPELLRDSPGERSRFMRGTLESLRPADLVFFDPDNGMEVPSKPLGRKGYCKYLAWKDLRDSWQAGQTVAVYQHFPRVKRETFLMALRDRLGAEAPRSKVGIVQTPHVAFCVAAQPRHRDAVRSALTEFRVTNVDSVRQFC